MKILLLHLSDAHINSIKDINNYKINKLLDALNVIKNFDECVIVFSGDLVNSGTKNEYKIVEKFLGLIISGIKKKYLGKKIINTLIVPGNHDLKQSKNIRHRQDIFKLYKQKKIDLEIENEVDKMKNFFNFANRNRCFINDKIMDKRYIKFGKFKICFNLINSSIFSLLKDEIGIHYIPISYIDELNNIKDTDLIISVIHHSPEWFMVNIKNHLKKAISKNSSIVLIGHEHYSIDNSERTNGDEYETKIIRGGILIDKKDERKSSFNALEIDTEKNNYKSYYFNWDDNGSYYKHEMRSDNLIVKNRMFLKKQFVDKMLSDEKHSISRKFTIILFFQDLLKQAMKIKKIIKKYVLKMTSFLNLKIKRE